MALANRILQAVITLNSGAFVNLESDLNLRVRIYKASLEIQNRATIEVYGLSKTLREQLLSQFSMWNRQQMLAGNPNYNIWAPVTIYAGWETQTAQGLTSNVATVFVGQVAFVEIISGPPNVGIRLTCYSRQIDKSAAYSTPAPTTGTFAQFVQWGATQMGFGNSYTLDSKLSNRPANNLGGMIYKISDILPTIQNAWFPNVAAFIDDNHLYVKDRNLIINPASIYTYSSFIGIPSWTEWGIEFTTLFDPTIRLAGGVNVQSMLNPSLNGEYVVMELEYDLTSREEAFYGKVNCGPPA
jgi:hypothetical protein